MSDIDVTLRLPEDLVERARAHGLLNTRRLSRLLETQIERVETWNNLDQSLEPARESFRADHPDMSEDDVMAMINEIVDEVRAEESSSTSEGNVSGSST